MTTSNQGPVVSLNSADHPVFKLRIDASGCRFDLRLNDIPVFDHPVSLPLVTEVIVSDMILDGENEIVLFVQPPAVYANDGSEKYQEETFDSRDSAISVSLIVKSADSDELGACVITTLCFEAGKFVAVADPQLFADIQISDCQFDRDVEVAGFWITRYVTLKSPYPRWAWLDAEVIDEKIVPDELFLEVRRIWKFVRDGDIKNVQKILNKKVNELSLSFWMESNSGRDDLELLPTLMRSKDLKLEPLSDEFNLEIFADGRLVRIVDSDGASPLRFTGAKGVSCDFGLTFCRISGEWVVIR